MLSFMCTSRISHWGRGTDPVAVHNLCLILKYVLYRSYYEANKIVT